MSDSTKLGEAREQVKACHLELIELETRAGIAEAAEKLRTEPPHYISICDVAEPYSEEQRKLQEVEENYHQKRAARRIRDLYFAVPDVELRKNMITKDREEGIFALRYWRQELVEAESKLETAHSMHRHWWVWASGWGVALLGAGFYLFGLIGGLGGLLVGYLNGRRMEYEALRARDGSVADAERALKEAQETWDEVRNQAQTFSQREAKTGERDPESLLRAV